MTTTRTLWLLASLAIILPGISTTAHAQRLPYDNQQQLLGAAATSPSSMVSLVERLMQACSAYDTTLAARAQQEVAQLRLRHQAYLDENQRVSEQREALYPAVKARPADDLAQTPLNKLIEAQYQAYFAPIAAAPTNQEKIELCGRYIDAITNQEFDLKRNDPTLAAFLDKRIASRKIAASLPATAAIIGKWQFRGMTRTDTSVSTQSAKTADSTVEFRPDFTWTLVSGDKQSSGTYLWLSNDRIEQTILISSYPVQVGSVAEKSIQLKGESLDVISEHSVAEQRKNLPASTREQAMLRDLTIISHFSRK